MKIEETTILPHVTPVFPSNHFWEEEWPFFKFIKFHLKAMLTLEQWQTLPKQTLILTAGALNLIQTGTAGALASRIHTFFLRGNQGTQPGHSSQAVQHQAQRDRDTRVIPWTKEARTQTHSGTDELRKLIREELTSFLGASGRPQPELIPALSEVSFW